MRSQPVWIKPGKPDHRDIARDIGQSAVSHQARKLLRILPHARCFAIFRRATAHRADHIAPAMRDGAEGSIPGGVAASSKATF